MPQLHKHFNVSGNAAGHTLNFTMENIATNGIDKKLKGLGIYQIVGGLAGLGITVWIIAQTATISGLVLLVFLIALGLYSYSVYCGTLLLNKKKHALIHSLINQYLQLINFAILGFGFKYISGLLLSVGIDLTTSVDMKFNFGVMSTWEMTLNSDTERIEINVNLVALFIILFIDKLQKQTVLDHNEAQLPKAAE